MSALIGAAPGDGSVFDDGIPCYPTGTTFSPQADGPFTVMVASQPAIAWAVCSPCRQRARDLAVEFSGTGPYPLLNELGLSDEYIAAKKAKVIVHAGLRAEVEAGFRTFVESLGYVLP